MKVLFFDTESDGLLDETTTLHSLVVIDIATGMISSFADQPDYPSIAEGLKLMETADVLLGHNVICHDLPVLQKLRGWKPLPHQIVRDTLVYSRLVWTDIKERDMKCHARGSILPPRLIGSHSLEAFGYRLGILKGEFGKTTDWKLWSPEMQEYCEQDCRVGRALFLKLQERDCDERAVELEHDFQEIIFRQERFGFRFDEKAAGVLHAKLVSRQAEVRMLLQEEFPPVVEKMKLPSWYDGRYSNGAECFATLRGPTKKDVIRRARELRVKIESWDGGPPREKIIPFNPGSRDQIAEALKAKYNWQPVELTETGKVKIDESVLDSLPYPEAKLLSEYMLLEKRLGQLAEGANAWLKLVKNGRIHGRVITNGAVTGRCTHMSPNVAQTPAVGVPYGEECRRLYRADDGFVQIGADASGLELRCFAHYLAKYDGGAYAKILLEGDIHSANRDALGLPPDKHHRGIAKTFIYAFLYGAGPLKIGRTLGVKDEEIPGLLADHPELKKRYRAEFKRNEIPFDDRMVAEAIKGKVYQDRFLENLPALAKLKDNIAKIAEEDGFLPGLDGRRLAVRSKHAALNTLLQSAGALLVKKATVILHEKLADRGYVWGKDFAQLAHIHDEIQLQARPEIANEIGTLAVESFKEAGEFFKFRIPITGEFKIGNNWAETH
jgi:DNA polymerase-1